MNVYNGTEWHPIGGSVQDTEPENPAPGALWLKTPINQLYVFNGDEWALIGPENVEGFGAMTRAISTVLFDSNNNPHPVIELLIAGEVIAIVSGAAFTIRPDVGILGFNNLIKGINLAEFVKLKGDIVGLADRASRLETPRKINGVFFDGQSDITITASTPGILKKGSYITGSNFNGSTDITWGVDASPNNVIGKVVARDTAGNFSANRITADLTGNVTGDVTSTGISDFNIITANEFRGAVLTGNSYTATRLQTARTINGVLFDGSANIDVTVDAENLIGTDLNTGIINSNLTKVGYLNELSVQGFGGIKLGNGSTTNFSLLVDGSIGKIKANTEFNLSIQDITISGSYPTLRLTPSAVTITEGGASLPAIIPDTDGGWLLGTPNKKFGDLYTADVYGTVFHGDITGNAPTADHAINATNLDSGQIGSLPYQSGPGTTTMLPPGQPGQVLQTAGTGNPPFWGAAFVRGMIMQWYGASNAVPSGWGLCDGTNGTPDLRNKFVVGAGSTYTMGTTGGSTSSTNNVNLTFTGTTSAAGAHSHGGSTGSTALSAAMMPEHYHNFTDVYAIVGDYGLGGSTASAYDRNGTYIYPSFYAGNASDGDRDNGYYGFPSRTDTAGGGPTGAPHNHSLSTDGNHNHSITVTANSGDIVVQTLPPYVALFYIMKL